MPAGKSEMESARTRNEPDLARESAVDVVVVNYNTYDDTIHCVDKLLNVGEVSASAIHVIDNMSPDGSGRRLATDLPDDVNFIQSPTNAGFGAGVNIGARAGTAPYILVLNPDCYPTGPCLGQAVDYLQQNPHVGIAGLCLRHPDGLRQYSARTFYTILNIVVRRTPLKKIFPGTIWNRRHLMVNHSLDKPFAVDWVVGTGFLIRRALFETLGGMDEAYFLYMEDVDLCVRVHIAGYEVHALPMIDLVHDHRGASRSLFSRLQWRHLSSLIRFARKFGLPLATPPRLSDTKARYAAWTAKQAARGTMKTGSHQTNDLSEK